MKNNKLTVIITILCISLCGYVFLSTNFFDVKNVDIVGLVKLNKEDVLLSGKIEINKNIYTYNLRKIKKNLLKNPYIKDVNIKRKFPNKLIIDLVERNDMCALPFMGSYVIINEEGIVLRVIQDIKKVDKPLLTGINFKGLELGKKISLADTELLSFILNLLNSCNDINILSSMSEINIDKQKKVSMYTLRGIKILLNKEPKDALDYKIKLLNKILIDLYTKNINSGVVDMTYGTYPVYKPE